MSPTEYKEIWKNHLKHIKFDASSVVQSQSDEQGFKSSLKNRRQERLNKEVLSQLESPQNQDDNIELRMSSISFGKNVDNNLINNDMISASATY